jgi:GcrA cell cycle regulator
MTQRQQFGGKFVNWTPELTEKVSRLWCKGTSAKYIATICGGNMTRNSVIGKMHRLGVKGGVKRKEYEPALVAGFEDRPSDRASPPSLSSLSVDAGGDCSHSLGSPVQSSLSVIEGDKKPSKSSAAVSRKMNRSQHGKALALDAGRRPAAGSGCDKTPALTNAAKVAAKVPSLDRGRSTPQSSWLASLPGPEAEIDRVFLSTGRGVRIAKLEQDMCRWPLGDPYSAEFRYCGEPQGDKWPYCQQHMRIAYVPSTQKQRENVREIRHLPRFK